MAANDSQLLTAEFATPDASLRTSRLTAGSASGAWPTGVKLPTPVGIPQVLPAGNRTPLYLVAKRTLDVVGAVGLLLVLSPLLAATWAVLMWTTRGKPFFSQERVGHCGRTFRMHKFRTMCLDADQKQHLVENEVGGPVFKNRRDPRVTRFGRVLRSFSIDELPQLHNVLRGEMTLVGPRPLPTREIARCTPRQRRRLAVKPGLTCLWQVSGRSEIGFDDWVRMDLWYVDNQSLATDLKLLLKTPLTVIGRRGAY